jgi:two-component system nitrate/nitrite response regulator NarL
VAVVSANPPGCEGLEVLQLVSESGLHTRVLVLGVRDELTVVRALADGAVGYLVKDSSGDTVCEAIEQIAGGESAFSPEVLGMAARQLRADYERPRETLSARQREILELISSGLSAEEVGLQLALSVSTVKTHLARVYEKLGVSGAPAAVREAMRRGLIA